MKAPEPAFMQQLDQQLQEHTHNPSEQARLLEQLASQYGATGQYLAGEWLLSHAHPQQALTYLSRAAAQMPRDVLAAHNHAEALRQSGQLESAALEFQRAVGLQFDFLPARYALIDLLEHTLLQMRSQGARQLAEQQAKGLSHLLNDTASLLLEQGQGMLSLELYQRALAHNPQSPAALSNLGNVLHQDGQLDKAEQYCRQALDINPSLASAWNNLGNVLAEREMHEEAADCYDRAAQFDPSLKAQALQNKYSGTLFNILHSDRYSDEEVFRKHRDWGLAHAQQSLAQAGLQPSTVHWEPGERIRVGYLSADFRSHAMRHYLEPLIAGHDPSKIEVVCYSQNPTVDEYTQRIMGYGPVWRPIHDLSDEQLNALIRKDGIHILVDCLGHTQGSRMAALAYKPAPVLMSYLGYLGTTGLPAMDYRITDTWMDPEGLTEKHHTETLLRIEGGSVGYMPHWTSPEVNTLPALTKGHVTFGSLNKLKKLNLPVVKLWSRILHQVPGSRLLLKTKQLADPMSAGRVLGWFEAQGIAAQRIELQPATHNHLLSYHDIDIALDPFPFGGGATSCDALWMGVPVITNPGTRSASRLTHCILNSIGRPQWSVPDHEAYVAAAVAMTQDLQALNATRQALRAQMQASPMMDAKGFAVRVAQGYEAAMQQWILRENAAANG